ncbi:MAG: hypothetical protein U5L09_22475 [Bacteroidales bacterium]|nr:hypothetical protein [Bacteroidales bacterium]
MEKSLQDYNYLLKKDPKNIEVIKKRVDVYRKMEKWEELLADFDTYLTYNPDDFYAMVIEPMY